MEVDNEKSTGLFLCLTMCSSWLTFPQVTVIPQFNNCNVEYVKQDIIGSSSNLIFASRGMVVKWSWVLPGIESDLVHDCSGLFGTQCCGVHTIVGRLHFLLSLPY